MSKRVASVSKEKTPGRADSGKQEITFHGLEHWIIAHVVPWKEPVIR